MNKISVELMGHYGNDNVVANVARVSFAGEGWMDLPEGYTEEQRDRLIGYLAREYHTSPFRHNFISIRCKVPIFLSRQLMKHQAGLSWNEVSRRYVTSGLEFFEPDAWRAKPEGSIKQGSADREIRHLNNTQFLPSAYGDHVAQCEKLYEQMIQSDVAPELARMVLPQSMQVEFIWSGNLLAFAHIYKLRAGKGAQGEAKDFAEQLDAIIRPLFPTAWDTITGLDAKDLEILALKAELEEKGN